MPKGEPLKIAVCVRRVPDTAEALVKVDPSGKDIVRDKLAFTVNESDNYALEEALLTKDNAGAEVTVISVGPRESVEVLRMGLAKGAAAAVRLDDAELANADAQVLARVLAAYLRTESFDLVFTGCIASDTEDSQVGPALAQALGWPHAAYVTKLEVKDGSVLVKRELEGGVLEVEELSGQSVISFQTGGNSPRYASIMGIKRAAAKPISDTAVANLGVGPAELEPRTTVERLYVPEVSGAAEMLDGTVEEKAGKLAGILKDKGLV